MAIVTLEREGERAIIDEASEEDLAYLLSVGFEYPPKKLTAEEAKAKAAADKAALEEKEAAERKPEEEAKVKAAEAKKK